MTMPAPLPPTVQMIQSMHSSHLQLRLPALRRETILRLQACTRLTGKLSDLFPSETFQQPPAAQTACEALASQTSHVIMQAGYRMSALTYWRELAKHIDKHSVTLIDSALGAELRLSAIRLGAQLAGHSPSPLTSPPTSTSPTEPQVLIRTLTDFAHSCLARWHMTLRAEYRPVARLKLPATNLPQAAAGHFDPVILYVAQEITGHV